jgi:hypothetical protein
MLSNWLYRGSNESFIAKVAFTISVFIIVLVFTISTSIDSDRRVEHDWPESDKQFTPGGI